MITQYIKKKNYNTSKDLIESISKFFVNKFDTIERLEDLHQVFNHDLLKRGTDQSTMPHKLLYLEFDKLTDSKIVKLYRELCREWVLDLSSQYQVDEWAVQRFPSVRVQFPGNVSVYEYHKDSTYSHPVAEINHFLAVTDSKDSTALQVEKHLGMEDYEPLNLVSGESAILNTSIFKHGDNINLTKSTRVSLDFRAMPVAALELTDNKNLRSPSKSKRMDLHDYYIHSDLLV